MSSSRGCMLVEYKENEWYAIVALDEYDYEFRSFEVFGPASTEDEAMEKVFDNCSNPGGSVTVRKDRVEDWEKSVIEKKYK